MSENEKVALAVQYKLLTNFFQSDIIKGRQKILYYKIKVRFFMKGNDEIDIDFSFLDNT